MSDEQIELKILFKNIHKGINTYGSVENLNNAFSDFLSRKDGNKDDIVRIIVDAICKDFKITTLQLFRIHSRGEIKQAKYICCCILHFELGMPLRTISRAVFKQKDHNFVFLGIKKHRDIRIDIKPDREYKDRYDRILKSIKDKIK